MNHKLPIAVLTVMGLLLLGAVSVRAQGSDTSGTDFWLTFPSNLGVTFANLSLFITGNANTSGTVTIPALGFSMPFTVTAGQVTTVNIPIGAELETSDQVQSLGIHVTAAANVTVYGLSSDRNPGFFSSDAYLGLPTAILGTDYVVLGYKTEFVNGGSQFEIVGTANGTTVTITPTVTEGNHPGGAPYTITLNQGDTYQLTDAIAGNDLTGSSITSTQPIAVFGGNQCADVPQGFGFCNLLVEELPPTSAWGKNFFTVPLATRSNGDTFRFLASATGTHVSVNGAVVATLNRGQFFEQIITGLSQITSDQPILVAQFSNSGSFDGASADPFMMLVPPAAQYLASYTVTTPLATQFNNNFVNIVAQTSGAGTITLDGAPIAAGLFMPIGASGFSGAQVPLSVGSHNLTGGVPFESIVYGFFIADGYGYVGGYSLSPIALVTAVALTPKVSTGITGTQSCLTATVMDQSGTPIPNVRVDFSVTGANAATGFTVAGANGQAQFCYSGTAAGADTVMAAVGTIIDTATVNWSNPTFTTPGTFSAAPGTATNVTLVAGKTGQFTIVFQPNPGFLGMVTFTCGNSIPNTICTISPATFNVTSNAPITLTVMLQTNCTSLLLPPGVPTPGPLSLPPGWGVPMQLTWILALAVLLFSLTRNGGGWARRQVAWRDASRLVASLALAMLVVTWAGCAASSGSNAIPGAPKTPVGSYNITLVGTSVGVGSQSLILHIRVI